MAFIINKQTKSKAKEIRLYYLVRNYRQGTKIKRETIFKLGNNKCLGDVLRDIQNHEEFVQQKIQDFNNRLERVKAGDSTAFIRFCPAWKQEKKMNEYINSYKIQITELEEKKEKIAELINTYPNCL